MSGYEDIDPSSLGPNMWLIDEMYRRYRDDPDAVSDAWKEFFEDFHPAAEEPAPTEREGGPPAPGPAAKEIPPGAERLRFGRERIVKNMEASLELPTATSFRIVPAKLLEENRRVVNRYLAGGAGGKVSFTHLIGWAVVNALEAVPAMKRSYVEAEGRPYAVTAETVNLGL